MKKLLARALALLLTLAVAAPAPAQLLSTNSLIVTVTSPAAGSMVSRTIPLTASVSIVGSLTVSRVDFYVDGGFIGSDSTAPYAVSWDTRKVGNGSHTLTAVAQDVLGVRWTSSGVSVTVANDTTRPTVTINQATGQADPTSASPINFTVVFSEPVSGFTGSDVAIGGTAAGAKTVSVSGGPSTYNAAVSGMTSSGTVSATIPAGGASDAAGNTNTASTSTDNTVQFNLPDTTAPTVSVTSPANGATVSGTITVAASATDNVGVTGVQFQLDGAAVGPVLTTAPYELPWDTTTVSDGTHTIAAKAVDAAGNVATSSLVTVTVSNAPPADTTPPTVSVSSPADGATVSGTITVAASATDNVGVDRVEFLLDGTMRATDTTSPYSVPWDTTTVIDGAHTIAARAFDAAGNVAPSATITVTVSNATSADTTPPTVSVSSPTDRATVSGTITVAASASDNVGVTGVQFLLDGAAVGPVLTVAPYEVPFDTTTVSDGTHTIAAQAADAAGNVAASATVTVTVANSGSGTARSEESAATFSGTGWTLRGAEIAAFSGGTAASSNVGGDTASFTFTGTQVSWIGLKCSICGIATVSIDGGAAIPVDTAGTAAVGTGAPSEIVFTSPTLAAGTHTLVITVTGTTTSGGAHIIVDAFDVTGGSGSSVTRIEQDNAAVSYAGTWVRDWPSPIASGGTFSDSNTAGATLTLSFTGREVRWLGYRCNECGIARVSVDGTFLGEVNTYAASPALAVVFAARELASGPHTLTIEVTGTRDPAAVDSWVIVDAFDVVTP